MPGPPCWVCTSIATFSPSSGPGPGGDAGREDGPLRGQPGRPGPGLPPDDPAHPGGPGLGPPAGPGPAGS
ncbi:MAG: hypothetical protein MZU97_11945 [Bacillus subtilis]|nr:hypothetical protein [Bacillus subtilis]